jgi:hypothetical protein
MHEKNRVLNKSINVLINIHFYIRIVPFIFENNIFLPLDFRTILYTMTKDKKNQQVDNLTEVESALTKTEQFLEANSKLIGIVIGAIVVVSVGYLGFTSNHGQPMLRSKCLWLRIILKKIHLTLRLTATEQTLAF